MYFRVQNYNMMAKFGHTVLTLLVFSFFFTLSTENEVMSYHLV
jgi:hypothetical protein